MLVEPSPKLHKYEVVLEEVDPNDHISGIDRLCDALKLLNGNDVYVVRSQEGTTEIQNVCVSFE